MRSAVWKMTREAFGELVRRRAVLETEKSALIVDEKTYAQQLDLLRFQVQEISTARLQPGEDKSVEAEFNRASNAAKLLQLSQAALDALSENENSLLTQSGVDRPRAGRTSARGCRRGKSGRVARAGRRRRCASCSPQLSHYADKVDVDPARLAELEERLNLLHSLKRKYGATLAEVIAFGDEAKQKLQSLESRDAELARLNAALEKLDTEILSAGKKLSAARKKVIPQLGQSRRANNSKIWASSKASLTWQSTAGDGDGRTAAPRSPRRPAWTRLNSSSRPIPASRPSRCAPSRRPAKWRA